MIEFDKPDKLISYHAAYQAIHDIGGCDAEDDYSRGWDAAIDEAIKELHKVARPERLSGDFNHGYTKAIQDMQETFASVQSGLQYFKKSLNYKLAQELLACCLANREALREDREMFIRWNNTKKEFECVKEKRR